MEQGWRGDQAGVEGDALSEHRMRPVGAVGRSMALGTVAKTLHELGGECGKPHLCGVMRVCVGFT